MASLALGVKFVAASAGTVDFVYSSAVTGYVGPAATLPAMVNGKTYRYRAESADLSQWEFGSGVYTSGTQTIARTTITLSSTGSKVSFSAAPFVGVVPFPDDILQFDDAMSLTTGQKTQARSNIGAAGLVSELTDVAWSTYTPTVSAGSGTLTTASATGRYKVVGKTVHLEIYATITTAGTGSGQLKATLPVNAAAFNYAGIGKESATTGKTGACQILGATDATMVQAIDYSGITFIANGAAVNYGITYESA